MFRAVLVGFLCFFAFSCGELVPNDKGDANSSFAQTIAFINENGLPSLSDLMPSLPNQLALVKGVELDSKGLPAKPGETSFSASELSSQAQVESLVNDAASISAQGFSEVRRLESLIFNFLKPVYEVMNQNDLFSQLSTGGTGSQDSIINLPDILDQNGFTDSSVVNNIFSQLLGNLSYTVELGESDVFPEFLKLSADRGLEKIRVSGLFDAGGDDLATGFSLGMKLNSIDDFDIDFTFAPAQLTGMIKDWQKGQCAEDLFRIQLVNNSGERSASVASMECPNQDGNISQLSLAETEGAMAVSGAFVQSFPGANSNSLRGFLGEKQGFVLQAATNDSRDKLSAQAAVLGESDFANPSKEKITQFGVGELLGKFINAKFWAPKLKAQKNYNGLSLSHYENPAFLLCNTFVSATLNLSLENGISEINKLCAGEDVPGESYLAGFSTLSNNIKNSSSSLASTLSSLTFGAISSSSVKNTTASTTDFLDKIVSVLKFRNNIHISSDASVFFKDAPDESYDPLVKALDGAAISTLGSITWTEEAKLELPVVSRSNLPKIEFDSSIDGLRDYFTSSCSSFGSRIGEETGKNVGSEGC